MSASQNVIMRNTIPVELQAIAVNNFQEEKQ